jgi:hypothetical protein
MSKLKELKIGCGIKWAERKGRKVLESGANSLNIKNWIVSFEAIPFVSQDPQIQHLFSECLLSLIPKNLADFNILSNLYYHLIIKTVEPNLQQNTLKVLTPYQTALLAPSIITPLTYYSDLQKPTSSNKKKQVSFTAELMKFDKVLLKTLYSHWMEKSFNDMNPFHQAVLLDFVLCKLKALLHIQPSTKEEKIEIIQFINDFIYGCSPSKLLYNYGEKISNEETAHENLFIYHREVCIVLLEKAIEMKLFSPNQKKDIKQIHEWIIQLGKFTTLPPVFLKGAYSLSNLEKAEVLKNVMNRLLAPHHPKYLQIHATIIFHEAIQSFLMDSLPDLAYWLKAVKQEFCNNPFIERNKQPLCFIPKYIQVVMADKNRILATKNLSLFDTKEKREAGRVIFEVLMEIFVDIDKRFQKSDTQSHAYLLFMLDWLKEMKQVAFNVFDQKYLKQLKAITDRFYLIPIHRNEQLSIFIDLLKDIFKGDLMIQTEEHKKNQAHALLYFFHPLFSLPTYDLRYQIATDVHTYFKNSLI